MSKAAMKDSTVGEVVNLMSVDAQRIQDVATYLWMIWSSPVQILVAVIFLYYVIGWAVLAGVAVLILMLPINAYVASIIEKLQVRFHSVHPWFAAIPPLSSKTFGIPYLQCVILGYMNENVS